MNRFATSLIAAAALGCTFAANAAIKVNAADLPHITNGGTGFIGVTESATMKTERMSAAAATTPKSHTGWMPATSQEASPTYDTQTLGAGPMSDPRMHRLWGTPQ